MKHIIATTLVALALAGCAGSDPATSNTDPDAQPARSADAVEVVITTTEIATAEIIVTGEKPTPCHELRSIMDSTGDPIRVEVWAEPGDAETCAQVIDPFEVSFGFETPSGPTSIVVNGVEVGRVGA